MNTTTGDDYTTPEFLSWWLGHPDHQRLFALGMPRSLDDASAWAARRIDLSTALAMRDMVDGFNPYGQYKTHPEYHCFGRECFFWDPHDRIGIREGELAALHPDLSGEEWSEVRANAFRRFAERSACSNSFDPQPDDVPF